MKLQPCSIDKQSRDKSVPQNLGNMIASSFESISPSFVSNSDISYTRPQQGGSRQESSFMSCIFIAMVDTDTYGKKALLWGLRHNYPFRFTGGECTVKRYQLLRQLLALLTKVASKFYTTCVVKKHFCKRR